MMSPARLPLVRSLVAVTVFGVATALPAQSQRPVERVQYARVIAQDYAFDAPSTVTSGIVTFHLVNQGLDVHQLSIIELGVGHTLKDFFDAMRTKGQPPAWTVEVGMTPTIQPHGEAFITARLAAGRYILSCLIPAKDGRSHVEKGMSSLLIVSDKAKASTVSADRKSTSKP